MDALVPSLYSQFDEHKFGLGLEFPDLMSEFDFSEYCMELALKAHASSFSFRTASTSPASPYSLPPTGPFEVSPIEAIKEGSALVPFASDKIQSEQMSFPINSSPSLYITPNQKLPIVRQHQGQAATLCVQHQEQAVHMNEQEREDSLRPRARRSQPKNNEDDEYVPPACSTLARSTRASRTRKEIKKKAAEELEECSLPGSSIRPRSPCRQVECRTRRLESKSPYQKRFACSVGDCTQSFRRCHDLKRHYQSCHQQSAETVLLVCPFRGQHGCKSKTEAYARPDSLKRHLHRDHGKDEAKWRPIYEKMVREYEKELSKEWIALCS